MFHFILQIFRYIYIYIYIYIYVCNIYVSLIDYKYSDIYNVSYY